jgi:hypothetical protein
MQSASFFVKSTMFLADGRTELPIRGMWTYPGSYLRTLVVNILTRNIGQVPRGKVDKIFHRDQCTTVGNRNLDDCPSHQVIEQLLSPFTWRYLAENTGNTEDDETEDDETEDDETNDEMNVEVQETPSRSRTNPVLEERFRTTFLWRKCRGQHIFGATEDVIQNDGQDIVFEGRSRTASIWEDWQA